MTKLEKPMKNNCFPLQSQPQQQIQLEIQPQLQMQLNIMFGVPPQDHFGCKGWSRKGFSQVLGTHPQLL